MRYVSLEEIAHQEKNSIVDGPFGSSLKTSDFVESGIPVLQGKNITGDRFSFSEIRFITEKKANELKRSSVEVGDFLMVKIGSIGYLARIDNLQGYQRAIIPANLCKIKIDENLIDPEYFKQIFKQDFIKKELLNISSKTAQPALSLSKIRKFKIPCPENKNEQIQIAQILIKSENLIKQRRESIILLDEFLKSTFLEMFGDPVRNEKEWDKDSFDNLVDIDCPLTYGIVQPGEEFTNGIPIIRPVDLTKTFINRKGLKLIDPQISDKFKRTLLKGNEILMCVRGTTGVVALASEELEGCNVTRGIVPIWFSKNYNTFFAFGLLKTKAINNEIQSLTYGATLQQINLSDLRKIQLINPPIELQNQYGLIVEKVESLKKEYEASLRELENMYGVLSQKAFKGELKLK